MPNSSKCLPPPFCYICPVLIPYIFIHFNSLSFFLFPSLLSTLKIYPIFRQFSLLLLYHLSCITLSFLSFSWPRSFYSSLPILFFISSPFLFFSPSPSRFLSLPDQCLCIHCMTATIRWSLSLLAPHHHHKKPQQQIK